MNNNFLIIGAGLSGCTIANLLSEKYPQAQITILEKRAEIAGNCADGDMFNNGIIVQKYGPHIFHTNDEAVWKYLSKFTEWNYTFVKPKVVIWGKEVPIPFNLNSLEILFPHVLYSKIEELLIEKYGYGNSVSILDLKQAKEPLLEYISNFILDNVFKNYVKKQWGQDYDCIDETVMRRVPVNISKDDRYFSDRYQGIPKKGFSRMIENMIKKPNIKVVLNTDYKNLINDNWNDNSSISQNSYFSNFDKIYVTTSIDEFFDYKYGVLPYRSLTFDYEIVESKFYQTAEVVSYPNNFDFTRITEHKRFYRQCIDTPYTVIGYEYPQEFKIGENERFYPISNERTLNIYSSYHNYAKEVAKNFIFVGRLGGYKYYNMDVLVAEILNMEDFK